MARFSAALALLLVALMSAVVAPAAAQTQCSALVATCNPGYSLSTGSVNTATACSSSTPACAYGTASECCVPLDFNCGTDASTTVCNANSYFDPTATYNTDNQGTCGTAGQTTCVKSGVAKCCVQKTCTAVDAIGTDFCPYGYQLKTGVATSATLTVENCCDRIGSVAIDDGTNVAFPACTNTNSGGAAGVQASTQDDTNWLLQDDNSFLRTVDKFQGMCFSVTINNECSEAESAIKSTCCTQKAPSYVQFKLPLPTGVTTDTGVQLANTRSNTLRGDNLRKCQLRYGRHITPARSFKPINRWFAVPASGAGDSNTPDARFVNIPIKFGRGAKQATVCIYTNNFRNAAGNVDCSWDSLCGYAEDGNVPTQAGNYMKGCEVRLVGRTSITSTPCCSPTYSIESVDFFPSSSTTTPAIAPLKIRTN